jgi:hypothetical protein
MAHRPDCFVWGSTIQTTARADAVDSVSHSLQSAQTQIRDGAHHASDKTVAYIREGP